MEFKINFPFVPTLFLYSYKSNFLSSIYEHYELGHNYVYTKQDLLSNGLVWQIKAQEERQKQCLQCLITEEKHDLQVFFWS